MKLLVILFATGCTWAIFAAVVGADTGVSQTINTNEKLDYKCVAQSLIEGTLIEYQKVCNFHQMWTIHFKFSLKY